MNYLAKFPKKDKKRSFNYLWHILSIAIFYSIPVVQLVVTYQRVIIKKILNNKSNVDFPGG